MPHNLKWYIQNHVLLQKIEGIFSGGDAIQLALDTRPFFRESDKTIHIVVDASKIQELTMTAKDAVELRAYCHQHRIGWVLVATGSNTRLNQLTSLLGVIFAQSTNIRFRVMNSVEESLAFLVEMDISLLATL